MPRHLLYLSLFSLATVVALVISSDRARRYSRQHRTREAEQREDALLDVLALPIHQARQQVTLEEFCSFLSREAGVQIELDVPAIEASGSRNSENLKIRLPRATVSLKTSLDLALAQLGLRWILSGNGLLITTPEQADGQPRRIGVYPLPQPSLTDASFHERVLFNDLALYMYPSYLSWDSHVSVPGGTVAVVRPDGLEQLRHSFAALAELDARPRTTAPVLLPALGSARPPYELISKLKQPSAVDCRAMFLEELIEHLAIVHELPLMLDYAGIKDANVSPEVPVSLQVSGSLQNVLWHIAGELDLTYAIHGDSVVITSRQRAQDHPLIVAYPVHDLIVDPPRLSAAVPPMRESNSRFEGCDSLIDVIDGVVEASTWPDGHIVEPSDGWLLVVQRLEAHQQIEWLLAEMRRALIGVEPSASVFAPTSDRAFDELVEAAVQAEIAFDYDGWGLEHICLDLTERLPIDVLLDKRQLKEAGIEVAAPLAVKWHAAPLRAQLKRLCDMLEIDFGVCEGALVLTTADEAEGHLIARAYDIAALIDSDFGAAYSADEIIDLVHCIVAPHSWRDVGGPAPLYAFRTLLLCTQTERNHRQIAALLDALRAHCLRKPGANPPTKPIWVGFDDIDRDVAHRLGQPANVTICGESWEGALARLAEVAGARLIVDSRHFSDYERQQGVTLVTTGETLSCTLERLISRHHADYTVRDNSLIVTSKYEVVDESVRLYPVADLLGDGWEAFERRLQTEVCPGKWSGIGIASARLLSSKWLVVRGTLAVHWQIEDWLYERRTGSKTQRAVERQQLEKEVQMEGELFMETYFGDGVEGFWRRRASEKTQLQEAVP